MGDKIQGISVVVPVGPHPDYKAYLQECFDSILHQMNHEMDEILVVDDQAHLDKDRKFCEFLGYAAYYDVPIKIIENEWLFGCHTSWNRGVAVAKNDLVLLMGSDDKLLDGALDALKKAYEQNNYKDAWYNLTIQLSDGTVTGVFNNAAAVTKGLWRKTGGFGLSAFASPDGWLISILMKHMPECLIQVQDGKPYYWARIHESQDTPRQAGFFNWEVIQIRDKETGRFQPNPYWAQETK